MVARHVSYRVRYLATNSDGKGANNMYRRTNAVLAFVSVLLLAKQLAAQQEVCANLFAQGYYDEHQTFSDQRSFKYVQSTICSDTTLTKEQSDDRSLGSGGSYYAVITGFLNVGDKQKSFEQQRQIFCSMNLDTATASAGYIATSRVVSQAATSVMKSCFDSHGFHAAIVPSKNPAAFAIKVAYHGDGNTDILIDNISGNPTKISCNVPTNKIVHSGTNVSCSKDADQTVQVTMNTDKGSLPAIDVLGTKDINNDIQSQLKTLTDRVAAVGQSSCLGCIEQSLLSELQFQNVNGSNWVLCDGRPIVNSKLAQLLGIASAPDLRGALLRGKNFRKFPYVEEAAVGGYEGDLVGQHGHVQRFYNPGSGKAGGAILWDGGKEFNDADNVFVRDVINPGPTVHNGNNGVSAADPNQETRPKNVTVNYFCKIN